MLYSASPNNGLVPSASIGQRCLSSFWRRPPRSSPARASFSGQYSVRRDQLAQESLIANSSVRELSKSVAPSSWTEKIIRHRSSLWRSSSTRGGRPSRRLLYFDQSGGHSPTFGKRSSLWSTDSAPQPSRPAPPPLPAAATHGTTTVAPPVRSEGQIPPDASSRLTTISRRLPSRSLGRLLSIFLSLSKPRLSFMIVLTTTTAYSLFPVPALLLPSTTASPSLSTLTLLFLTMGTALSSASANTLNMLFEPKYDAMMSRTRNRPLVRGLVTPGATTLFAAVTGMGGLGLLLFGVNPTVAALGGLNIFLYAFVYTPMKRVSVLNTWVGAVVGGIPPLMGWAAAKGQCATGRGDWQELLLGPESAGGWLLAALIFAWQFPHFNALSWNIRDEYRQAGHRMLAWVNPKANARVALRYAILCFPICFGLWAVGVTDQAFLLSSSLVNAWLVREAWRFWRNEGAKGSARALFWASVWHLPVVMVLAMLHKNGLWSGIRSSLTGESEDDVDDEIVHDHRIGLVSAASIPVQQNPEA